MYTVDDLVSELFHLQDYGMGEMPIKIKVFDKHGCESFYLSLDNVKLDESGDVKEVVLVGYSKDKNEV